MIQEGVFVWRQYHLIKVTSDGEQVSNPPDVLICVEKASDNRTVPVSRFLFDRLADYVMPTIYILLD